MTTSTPRPLQWYIERADELAQKVVNDWCRFAEAGNVDTLTSESKELNELADAYRKIKQWNNHHRKIDVLTSDDEEREKEARLAFAEAYKALDDSVEKTEPLSRNVGG
ncbi:MAG: hypothetical protein ACYDDI_03010 [Candidatus Acidiferrales bacterium]